MPEESDDSIEPEEGGLRMPSTGDVDPGKYLRNIRRISDTRRP